MRIGRVQALAFRLAGHHLDRNLAPGELTRAAGACGTQNTPPGAAALSLAARIRDLTPGAVEHALETDKTLVQVRSFRTAPHVFPAADLRCFILGAGPALDAVGLSGTALADRVAAKLLDGWTGGRWRFAG